jgi:hypothetical protein
MFPHPATHLRHPRQAIRQAAVVVEHTTEELLLLSGSSIRN